MSGSPDTSAPTTAATWPRILTALVGLVLTFAPAAASVERRTSNVPPMHAAAKRGAKYVTPSERG